MSQTLIFTTALLLCVLVGVTSAQVTFPTTPTSTETPRTTPTSTESPRGTPTRTTEEVTTEPPTTVPTTEPPTTTVPTTEPPTTTVPTTEPPTTTVPTTEPPTSPAVTPGCNETRADIAFLVDSSNSIGPVNFELQKNFIINVTDLFDIGPNGSQISVVTFASGLHPQFLLNEYDNRTDMVEAIRNISFTPGNTMTHQALAFAQTDIFKEENGDRPDVADFIVLMTDGESTNKTATNIEAERLNKSKNITVFTVGIGPFVNASELNAIASIPDYNLRVENFEELGSLVESLSPSNFCPTPAITETTPPLCYVPKADMVFMLDSSNSVGTSQFEVEKSFVSNVVKRFEIGPDNIQIAAITFESDPHLQFYLNDYSNKSDVLSAIQQIKFQTGNTLTGKAIRYVMDNVFQNTTGDRDDAENILVILTDGRSTDENDTLQEAEALRNTNTKVFAIGIGLADDNELKALATDLDHEFLLSDFDALASIENEIDVSTIDCGLTVPPTTTQTTTPPTTTESCDSRQWDVVFLLDSSNSEGIANFNRQKEFVQNFVRSVSIGPSHVLLSVVTFESNVHPQFSLNQYQTSQDLLQAIGRVPYTPGNTFTGKAIQYAMETSLTSSYGARPIADDLVIVLTDGRSTDYNETLTAAEAIHNISVQVIAIGIGANVDNDELKAIATSDENIYHVTSFETLNGILDLLGNTTCLPTPPTTVTSIEPTKATTAFVQKPKTTSVTQCARKKIDLIFMLDSSNSQGLDNFNKQKQFVYDVVQNYVRIGAEDVQVGLVTFSNDVYNQFNLSTYQKREDVLNAIRRIPFLPGNTFTGAALKYIRTESFTPAAGDRADADNILIVTTDGDSTDKINTTEEAFLMHNTTDIKVMAIGIGAVNTSELQDIASSDEDVYRVIDFDALINIRDKIETAACIDMNLCEDLIDCENESLTLCKKYDSYARRNCPKFCGYCS